MFAKDFRAWARDALRGHWGTAIAVSLVASLLAGGSGSTSQVELKQSLDELGISSFLSREIVTVILTVSVVMALLSLVIGGVVQLGQSSFYLNLIKGRQARFSDLFGQFHRLWKGFCMQFIMGLFIFLWSLLLVVPGIIAAYRYAMVPYLMAEFPDLGVMDAMAESKRLMHGNKARLFCLQLSFLGWTLLSALTLGIGMLWVNPYSHAAEAAFYMTVTGREGIWRPENLETSTEY